VALITAVFALTSVFVIEPADPALAGQAYYLAPGGSDAQPGTADKPWASFTYALTRLRPGDSLIVRGGEYREQIRNPSVARATPNQPIRVMRMPGERPTIRGLLWLRDIDHWIISGIDVTWDPITGESDEHMVKITNGVGWRLEQGEFWGARSFAAVLVASTRADEPRNWTIANNCIHDTESTNGTNEDHLIYANTQTGSGGTISGNLLFDAPNGSGVKLGGPSDDSVGTHDVRVIHNTIAHTGQNILIAWTSSRNEVVGNLLIGVEGNRSNIRAYQLSGTDNVATGNAGGGSGSLFEGDTGYLAVADGGGNVWPFDPGFPSEFSCDDLGASNPSAAQYGHFATDPSPDIYFDDIAASSHAADINAIAEANITRGCAPRLYCPTNPVTRAEMASFIARALDLAP